MRKSVFKIAILGDGGVGKSSLIKAKSEGIFNDKSKITIGVDIQCIPFEVSREKEDQHLMVVDLGGQPRFHFIHDAYITGIKGAIILYDLNRFRTFLNLSRWFKLIKNENPSILIFLVGNKSDLISEQKKQFYLENWASLKTNIPNANKVVSHLFVSSKNIIEINILIIVFLIYHNL